MQWSRCIFCAIKISLGHLHLLNPSSFTRIHVRFFSYWDNIIKTIFLIIQINYLDSFLNHPSNLRQFDFILAYTIIDYFITCYLGSKEGTCIATAWSPSGSYTTVLGWLKAHSPDRIKIPESSDVISFFDNSQGRVLLKVVNPNVYNFA